MLSSAEGMRARSLLRRHWRATIALGVFAGVAGGAALGVWGIARRTSTVYDRFTAYEGAGTLTILGCTDGIGRAEIETRGAQICADYDYADLREFLTTVPEVVSAGRFTQAQSRVASADDPARSSRQLVVVAIDPGAIAVLGRPILVDGRLADPEVATEATINEEEAFRLGVGVGDQLVITPYTTDESDIAGEGAAAAGGVRTTVTVVGITRRPSDLADRLGGTSIYEDNSAVSVGPAWWREIGGDAAAYGIGVSVLTTSPVGQDAVIQAVTDRWPGRPWQQDVGELLASDRQHTVRDAIRLQTVGLLLVAAVMAIAGLLFAGQAVSRQSRSEWADAPVLDAIGMTRRGMVAASAFRAAMLAGVAATVAMILAIASSPLGPIGIGRAAEPHRGISVDWLVLGIGLPLVVLSVMLCAVAPIAALRTSMTDASAGASHRTIASLPPSGLAGWAITNSRRAGRLALGSAIVGVAFAAAAGVASWSLVNSYNELRAEPARYGSTWDATVANVGSQSQQDDTRARLASIPGIEAVGLLSTQGIQDDPTFTIFAGEPFLGDVDFGTIIAGRAPTRSDEIALGRASMRAHGVGIGDTFIATFPDNPDHSFSFGVVGEVAVNDASSARPGVGALVTPDEFAVVAPGNLSANYAVYIEPGVDHGATLTALQEAFPTTFHEHSTPRQITNLGLVSSQPVWLAAIIGLLAGTALVHALITSVRANRRQIGVLKSIGFTRRQVMSTVAWHASLLTAAALMIGIPLGVVIGRMTWGAIVDNLGVVSAPVVPFAAIVGVAVIVLVVANLAALGPGWAAARTRSATALRAE